MSSKTTYDKIVSATDETSTVSLPKAYILRCAYENCNSRVIKYATSKVQSPIDESNKAKIHNHELVYDMLHISPTDHSVIAHPKDSENSSKEYFIVESMWDFDNIGVSKTKKEFNPESVDFNLLFDNDDAGVRTRVRFDRYLICSDCNRGPIGFAGFITKDEKEDRVIGGEGDEILEKRDDVEDLQKYVKEADNRSIDDLRYFLSCDSIVYQGVN